MLAIDRQADLMLEALRVADADGVLDDELDRRVTSPIKAVWELRARGHALVAEQERHPDDPFARATRYTLVVDAGGGAAAQLALVA